MKITKLSEIKKAYFGYEEIAKALSISPASARVSAVRYVKQGFLVRIKRNLYVLKGRWEAMGAEERFELANIMQVPSYVSFMSALEYHGITTQVQRSFVESAALKRTKETDIGGVVFRFTRIKKELYFGFRREKGFFIASPEKAFIDALYLMSYGRYSLDMPSLDINKLDKDALRDIVKKFPIKTRRLAEKYGRIKTA